MTDESPLVDMAKVVGQAVLLAVMVVAVAVLTAYHRVKAALTGRPYPASV